MLFHKLVVLIKLIISRFINDSLETQTQIFCFLLFTLILVISEKQTPEQRRQ